jgi:hypothetical protein
MLTSKDKFSDNNNKKCLQSHKLFSIDRDSDESITLELRNMLKSNPVTEIYLEQNLYHVFITIFSII